MKLTEESITYPDALNFERRIICYSELLKVLQKAVEIIRQDICSVVCEVDTYSPSTESFSDVEASVPDSFLFLMEYFIRLKIIYFL